VTVGGADILSYVSSNDVVSMVYLNSSVNWMCLWCGEVKHEWDSVTKAAISLGCEGIARYDCDIMFDKFDEVWIKWSIDS
jgi:hypothetical protein